MSQNLNVAIIQSQLFWEAPEANRLLFEEKIAALPDSVDMVVLPEMFTTGFTMAPHHLPVAEGAKTLQWMLALAQQKNAAIVGSSVIAEGNLFYNRLFFVMPDGSYRHYDKRHTFSLAGEHQVYEAGIEKVLVNFRGFVFCPLICYDLRFPVWARNVEDYDVLLYVANWPKPRIAAWDTLLKARAIENMAYCLGCNRIGIDELGYEYPGHSAAYDVLGHQMVFSEHEASLQFTISKEHITTYRDKLKFLKDRDEFNLL